MNLQEFISKWNGKKADWDGAYGGQCVDLFRFYNHEVMGISQPRGVVGAADFWDNYDTDQVLKQNFTKISNTPEFIPQSGDVMIWNKNAGGGYGHIAIVSDYKHTTKIFQLFDQNWSRVSYCELVEHSYTNVLGVLRPKGETMSEDALQACLKDREKFWKERDEAQAELAKANEEIAKLNERIKQERKAQEAALEALRNEQSQQCDSRLNTQKTTMYKQIEKLESQVGTLKKKLLTNPTDWKQRFTSRKFISGLIVLILPILNRYLDLGMDAAEILATVTPIMAFIGFEGWTDYKERIN